MDPALVMDRKNGGKFQLGNFWGRWDTHGNEVRHLFLEYKTWFLKDGITRSFKDFGKNQASGSCERSKFGGM